MALKQCKECKKDISSDATTCPLCGKKRPHGMSPIVKFGGGFLVFIFGLPVAVAMCSGGGASSARGSLQGASSPVEAPAPTRPVIDVDAIKLWKDYEANEVAADDMYKGQLLRVSGKVADIRKDAFNNIVVGLQAPNMFMSTHATMNESDAASVARLAKGMQVSLACEGGGRIIGSPILRDCRLAR